MSIKRYEVGPRMSNAVVHGNTVYLRGICSEGVDITDQTKKIIAEIDRLLAEVGSDKSKILQATIWLVDMSDFAAMNSVWENWVAPGAAPARATGEVKLSSPEFKIEIIVTAAI